MTEPRLPPVAARKPHRVDSPHGTRTDEYYWLRDDTRTDPQVLAYLVAENAAGGQALR
jgi:oligopeptidase B